MPYYLETSAFFKLLVAEPESEAMRAWFFELHPCWSSRILVTESCRAGGRLGLDRRAVEDALDAVALVLPAATTFELAANLKPPELRSLDALHLAAALELGDDLDGVVTYDARLIDSARAAGLPVVTPVSR